jgi:hypothetical protein
MRNNRHIAPISPAIAEASVQNAVLRRSAASLQSCRRRRAALPAPDSLPDLV